MLAIQKITDSLVSHSWALILGLNLGTVAAITARTSALRSDPLTVDQTSMARPVRIERMATLPSMKRFIPTQTPDASVLNALFGTGPGSNCDRGVLPSDLTDQCNQYDRFAIGQFTSRAELMNLRKA